MRVTSDLEDFGWRELRIARDLLDSMIEDKLPEDFSDGGIRVAFNTYSGKVFLTNDDYQVAMLNGEGALESWYHCPECGEEGFADDTKWDYEERLCGVCSGEIE